MKQFYSDDNDEAPTRIELEVVGCPDCGEDHYLLTFDRDALGWLSGGELGLQLSRDEVAALYQELAANLGPLLRSGALSEEEVGLAQDPENLPPEPPQHLQGLF